MSSGQNKSIGGKVSDWDWRSGSSPTVLVKDCYSVSPSGAFPKSLSEITEKKSTGDSIDLNTVSKLLVISFEESLLFRGFDSYRSISLCFLNQGTTLVIHDLIRLRLDRT